MNWLELIQKAFANLGGIASLPMLYAEIGKLRGATLTHTDQATVRKEIERHSSDSEVWQEKQDLFISTRGVGRGVWGLRNVDFNTPAANDSEEDAGLPSGQKNPGRKMSIVYRVIRDTQITKALKLLHQNQCQLCDTTLKLADGTAYSEAHHLKPLGNPHRGPDTPDNVIVVCPNCHVLMDYFAIPLDAKKIKKQDYHKISPEFISYHNSHFSNQ